MRHSDQHLAIPARLRRLISNVQARATGFMTLRQKSIPPGNDKETIMAVKKKGKLSGLHKKTPDQEPPVSETGFSIPDSFSQLWLVGLGALAKAQTEGPKLLEALIAEGSRVQKGEKSSTRAVLGGLEKARESLASGGDQVRKQAGADWDRLESIFRDRVGKALLQLGAPSANDVAEMAEQIEALKKRISALEAQPGKTPKTRTRAKIKAPGNSPA